MGHTDIVLIGVALVAQALREMGVPCPGVTQSALIVAGYDLAGGHALAGSIIITAVYAGSLCGAIMAYLIGGSLGAGLVRSRGRYLCLSARNLERARDHLGTGTLGALTAGRMIPATRAPLSVVAGMMRLPMAVFATGVSLSTLAWAGLIAGLGSVFGRRLAHLAPPPHVRILVALMGGTVLVASLASLWWRSRQDLGGDGMRPR
jgi:membrane protein DedA with SNARE-associated domain